VKWPVAVEYQNLYLRRGIYPYLPVPNQIQKRLLAPTPGKRWNTGESERMRSISLGENSFWRTKAVGMNQVR
jgi:hypothetical protein